MLFPRSLGFIYVVAFASIFQVRLAVADAVAKPRTVYSVGDLHGDLDHFKLILEGLGVCTFEGDDATWTGGATILVSTGDSVDRGVRSKPIYAIWRALAKQAPEQGGEVVNVMGNHDLWNLMQDLRYVAKAEMAPTGDYGGAEARKEEFSPRGTIGADIRDRFVAAAVREGTLFVHAGLEPSWLKGPFKDLEALNAKVRELLQQEVVAKRDKLWFDEGPFMTRTFALKPEATACPMAEETLKLVGADRMTVGHTIQDDGITTRCKTSKGPRLILADTAISRAYGPGAKPSAVEYLGRSVTAIYFVEGKAPRREPIFEDSLKSDEL